MNPPSVSPTSQPTPGAPPSPEVRVAELLAEHQEALLRYAHALLRQSLLAEDVVQEAFIRYLRATREGEAVQNPRAWLYRVTHNLALDAWRRQRHTTPLDDDTAAKLTDRDSQQPDALAANRDTSAQALLLLNQLDERQRLVVVLKVMDKRSYEDIATILGTTATNVGYILHHALKKLATSLRARID